MFSERNTRNPPKGFHQFSKISICNLYSCYLYVERSDKDKTSRVWNKLIDKVNRAISKGESTILIGDLNRPLNNDRPCFGTKLLTYWIEEGYIKLLNKRSTPTRFNPVTGKGSPLELSKNFIRAVQNFEVDSKRPWTRLSMQKKWSSGNHPTTVQFKLR